MGLWPEPLCLTSGNIEVAVHRLLNVYHNSRAWIKMILVCESLSLSHHFYTWFWLFSWVHKWVDGASYLNGLWDFFSDFSAEQEDDTTHEIYQVISLWRLRGLPMSAAAHEISLLTKHYSSLWCIYNHVSLFLGIPPIWLQIEHDKKYWDRPVSRKSLCWVGWLWFLGRLASKYTCFLQDTFRYHHHHHHTSNISPWLRGRNGNWPFRTSFLRVVGSFAVIPHPIHCQLSRMPDPLVVNPRNEASAMGC